MFVFDKTKEKFAIGLMSGTSVDGIDAALVQISGAGETIKVKLVDFISVPYQVNLKQHLLKIADGKFGGSAEICQLNFLVGELSADICESICEKNGVNKKDVAFVGSHGHTIWHSPKAEEYFSCKIKSTLQIGEGSCISQRIGCVVVSDFRVRDIAAGGDGAPLVPYSEFLLYKDNKKNIALQNIGGIGNVTLLPKGGSINDVIAFDTGPGNMVMDAIALVISNGEQGYDEAGAWAAQGTVNEELLAYMLNDDYLEQAPPKTTGRERYGSNYVTALLAKAKHLNIDMHDVMASACMFTAKCIALSIEKWCNPLPDRFIVGGGGSHNITLLNFLTQLMPFCEVITNEALGLNSDAKEAIAFAVLANETLAGNPSNVPTATGAKKAVVLGKLSF